jgi:hypothetical protein
MVKAEPPGVSPKIGGSAIQHPSEIEVRMQMNMAINEDGGTTDHPARAVGYHCRISGKLAKFIVFAIRLRKRGSEHLTLQLRRWHTSFHSFNAKDGMLLKELRPLWNSTSGCRSIWLSPATLVLFRRIKLIHEPPLVEAATGLSVSCATLVAVVKAPAGHSSRNSPPQIGQKIFYVRIPICRTLVGTVPGRESAAVPREFLNKRRLITRPITIWIASSTIEEVFRLAWPTDEKM